MKHRQSSGSGPGPAPGSGSGSGPGPGPAPGPEPEPAPAPAPVEPWVRELQTDEAGRLESSSRAVEDSLSMSLDVSHVSACSDPDCGCLQMQQQEWRVNILQQHLQLLLSKADDLHERLGKSGGFSRLDEEDIAADLLKLIRTSQPFFNVLESSARSTECQYMPIRLCFKMLDFSQQLCGRFEQLLSICATYNILSMDESDLYSTPYFCIGSCQLGPQTVTAFRYCKLVPYIAHADTGLYKRMRWNVDDRRKKPQREQLVEGEAETFIFTDYYFLCYEDLSMELPEVEGNSQAEYDRNSAGLWSIGQWVQLDPNPSPENLYDWILCEVPQATYQRMLSLGSEEPSCSSATDHLHQLLLSLQSKQMKGGTGNVCEPS
ncbi:UPF0575 protein C19orf67 homolog [Gouania willdenowi]|uniref:Uncharacterized protein n=1 Tax=Gouania willdenowi TaxID=441366 RepID=A0A8C5I3D4_GOUWI|nr:UPF0575 protein C19orf67 homolog [Gouania willdenowi]